MIGHLEAGEPNICSILSHRQPQLLILITESTTYTNKKSSSCSKVAQQRAQLAKSNTLGCPVSTDRGPNRTQCRMQAVYHSKAMGLTVSVCVEKVQQQQGKFRSPPHPPLHFLLLFLFQKTTNAVIPACFLESLKEREWLLRSLALSVGRGLSNQLLGLRQVGM